MLIRSQRPFYLSAYGLFALNLENFLIVRIILTNKYNNAIKYEYYAGAEMDLYRLYVTTQYGMNIEHNAQAGREG